MDHLFSSPEKEVPRSNRSTRTSNGIRENVNVTISSEEDMDVGESRSSRRETHILLNLG